MRSLSRTVRGGVARERQGGERRVFDRRVHWKGRLRMDVSCLQHRLTEDERRTFNETGLLTVENALSPAQVQQTSM